MWDEILQLRGILSEVSCHDWFSLSNHSWSEELLCGGSWGGAFRRNKRRSGQEIPSYLLKVPAFPKIFEDLTMVALSSSES